MNNLGGPDTGKVLRRSGARIGRDLGLGDLANTFRGLAVTGNLGLPRGGAILGRSAGLPLPLAIPRGGGRRGGALADRGALGFILRGII